MTKRYFAVLPRKDKTIKTITAVTVGLLLASASAYSKAADFEINSGVSRYGLVGSGIWWDENYPHSLDINNPAFSIGFTGNLTSGFDWRLGYLDLGELHTTSMGLANDLQPERGFMSTFVTESHVTGLYGSVLTRGSIYFELGLFAFKPDFKVTMYDMIYDLPEGQIGRETVMGVHKAKWAIKPFLGAGWRYNNFKLSIAYYTLDNKETDQYSTVYKNATTVMVGYVF